MGRDDRWVRRTGPNTYALDLPEDLRTYLGRLVDELRALLEASTDDPAVRRLFPTAYHDDPDRDREYQQLARDELLERRVAALDATTATLAAETLDQPGLTAWMGAVNDLRLVLGTQLDVSEDEAALDPADPAAPAQAAYRFLGYVLEEIVAALTDGLGDEPSSPGVIE